MSEGLRRAGFTGTELNGNGSLTRPISPDRPGINDSSKNPCIEFTLLNGNLALAFVFSYKDRNNPCRNKHYPPICDMMKGAGIVSSESI